MIQVILNGIIASSWIVIVAISFSVIYRVVRFFHFAHGIVLISGPYLTYTFSKHFGFPLFISCCFAVALSTLLGCLMELLLYRPLRQQSASPMVLLLASLGIFVVLQNAISLIFGDDPVLIYSGVVEEGISILGARITHVQIITVVVSIFLMALTSLVFAKTRIGVLMRAVADDPELAEVSGIASGKVVLWSFMLGSALASVAGILIALDISVSPNMGMDALLMGVVAMIIGGVGSIPGIALGGLLIGMAQHLGVWKISSLWQDVIVFAILLFFLLLRPQGFLGKRVKKATV